jgi:hypothetical protein
MTRPYDQIASTDSPDRGPAVRFLQICSLVFPQRSDAAFVAADPEARFHA